MAGVRPRHFGSLLRSTGRLALVVVGASLAGCHHAFPSLADGRTPDSDAGPPSNPEIAAISVGSAYACALNSDGVLKCWGWNEWGMLGQGDTSVRAAPTEVKGLSGIRGVVASVNHTCALTTVGGQHTVHCWGYNGGGQLGDGSTKQRLSPSRVAEVVDADELAAGHWHTCVRHRAGEVSCWGHNSHGQVGDGTTTGRLRAQPVAGLAGCTAARIAARENHTCVLCSSGEVRCWGENDRGQLGDGSTVDAHKPTPVTLAGGSLLDDARGIWAGESSTCAIRSDGQVLCWGGNSDGQVDGTAVGTDRLRAGPVYLSSAKTASLSGVTEMALGERHACALVASGPARKVLCWGSNVRGALGDGTTTSQLFPQEVPELSQVMTLAGAFHTNCAVTPDEVVCWGNNSRGEIGDGVLDSLKLTPQKAQLPPGVVALDVDAGERHTCALGTDHRVYCWGRAADGELGAPDMPYWQPTPVVVRDPSGSAALEGIEHLAAGYRHTCAGMATGTTYCWGDNTFAQLGDGTQTSRSLPALVIAAAGGPAFAGAVDVAAGGYHTCLIKDDDRAYCFGRNNGGQLARPLTVARQLFPTLVGQLPVVHEVATGDETTCARQDTSLWCWGSDQGGVTGTGVAGNELPQPTAVQFPQAPSFLSHLAVGRLHACAAYGGTAICWGAGSYGRLGSGGDSSSPKPAKTVDGLDTVVDLDVSPGMDWIGAHSCAVTASGTVHCWGYNEYGQLGDGTRSQRDTAGPTIAGISGAQKVTTGAHHSCAIDGGGSLWCWGHNGEGALGIGQLPIRTRPTAVVGL